MGLTATAVHRLRCWRRFDDEAPPQQGRGEQVAWAGDQIDQLEIGDIFMRIRIVSCIAALCAAVALAAPAAAQENVKIGFLRCDVAGGLGLIIASSKEMQCVFTTGDGRAEHYLGTIRKFGLDIGATNAGTLGWDVLAPTLGPLDHSLAGDFAGVTASATVGAGLGANAMVGGAGHQFALQPISVQTQTGLDLAGGVSSMTLRPGLEEAPPPARHWHYRHHHRHHVWH
jgi:hypothetical protein